MSLLLHILGTVFQNQFLGYRTRNGIGYRTRNDVAQTRTQKFRYNFFPGTSNSWNSKLSKNVHGILTLYIGLKFHVHFLKVLSSKNSKYLERNYIYIYIYMVFKILLV